MSSVDDELGGVAEQERENDVFDVKKRAGLKDEFGVSAGSSLEAYLREIGGFELLTLGEEIQLAACIKKGGPDAEAARNRMITCNLRLVVTIAHSYDYGNNLCASLEDLINEGNIGLAKAVDHFEPQGAKFSTYAAYWIKQSIRRALSNQSRTVRLPVNKVADVLKMNKLAAKLGTDWDCDLSVETLAKAIPATSEQVRFWRRIDKKSVSMDASVGEDGHITLGEMMPDKKAGNPADAFEENTTWQDLLGYMNGLTERERGIIISRFGLNEEEPQTLEKIAGKYKISRERARQIEIHALDKLRKALEDGDKLIPREECFEVSANVLQELCVG